jgi:hypothetical protein
VVMLKAIAVFARSELRKRPHRLFIEVRTIKKD